MANVEPSILSRTAIDEEQTPFYYLLGAWKRAIETARGIRNDRDSLANEKNKILAEIRRLCVSYAGLSIMMPDMFGYLLCCKKTDVGMRREKRIYALICFRIFLRIFYFQKNF
jgi:hypothetical protein